VILGVPPLREASRRFNHTLIFRIFLILIFSDVWQYLFQELVLDNKAYKSRIGAPGRDAAEANDQGVRRNADEVKSGEVLFSISESIIPLITNNYWTWDGKLTSRIAFSTRESLLYTSLPAL
jgi:hypothetical protein